jgi:hypothetical protein
VVIRERALSGTNLGGTLPVLENSGICSPRRRRTDKLVWVAAAT